MTHWELIDEREAVVEVNGINRPCQIRIEAADDSESVDGGFDYGSAEENEAEMERFRRGLLVSLVVRVTATAEAYPGCEGHDALAACFVRSSHASKDLLAIVEEHTMVVQAVKELASEIKAQALRDAAPELLDACRNAERALLQYRDAHSESSVEYGILLGLRAAIAKAGGSQ